MAPSAAHLVMSRKERKQAAREVLVKIAMVTKVFFAFRSFRAVRLEACTEACVWNRDGAFAEP